MEIKTMNLFGIEPFEAPKRRNIQTVQLTVNDSQIMIPNIAYEKFGKPKFAEVGFNDQKKFFALKPLQTETKYSVEIGATTIHQIARTAIVKKIYSLRPWDMRFYNLILDKGQFDEDSGYWLFDLDMCQEVSRKNRNRRSK